MWLSSGGFCYTLIEHYNLHILSFQVTQKQELRVSFNIAFKMVRLISAFDLQVLRSYATVLKMLKKSVFQLELIIEVVCDC